MLIRHVSRLTGCQDSWGLFELAAATASGGTRDKNEINYDGVRFVWVDSLMLKILKGLEKKVLV